MSPVLQFRRKAQSLKNRLSPACVVLCYHRVSDETGDYWGNAISLKNFEDHVALVSERYRVLSIGQLVESVGRGKPPARRSIVITFDDGYAVNTEGACRSLSNHRAPAAFYLNTGWLTGDRFWWDELTDAMPDEECARTVAQLLPAEAALSVGSGVQRRELIAIVRNAFKAMRDDHRREVLRSMRHPTSMAARPDSAPMRISDIAAIARDPLFTIAGHTHTHPALSLLPPDRQRAEIQENKRILEHLTGQPIRHFSYPFGGPDDFDDSTIAELRLAGYLSAVTTLRRPVRWPCDVFRIPRLSVKNWDVRKFQKELDGAWSN